MKSPSASQHSPQVATRRTAQAAVYRCAPWARNRRHQAGSAVLVVFILLGLMVGFLLANARALHHMKQEIRLIEQRQLRKFTIPTNHPTNGPAPHTLNHWPTNATPEQSQSP